MITEKSRADALTEAIMEQAQVYASAWSLIGGPFDDGNALETAEQEKAELRNLVGETIATLEQPPMPVEQHEAAPAAPRTEMVGAVPNWRELSRRLYVELFHCDQQMCSTFDEDGEPYWFQGATVRDVLADAKAALESTPPADAAAAPPIHEELEAHKRMLGEACRDLGLIHEALGLDHDDAGGAAPILDAITELKARADAAAAPARYFVYDNECGYEVFDTDEERAKAHQAAIDGYLDDGWCGEVTSVVSGIVTHHTVKTDVETKPAPCVNHPDHDDEDCDACAAWNEWPNHEFDEICRYVPDPIPAQPATLALTDEQILEAFAKRHIHVYGEDGEVRPIGNAVIKAARALLNGANHAE
ncbi:MAG TPA: hypothetical protein VMT67_01015 [Terriglobales bacterium]|nr:hypothetical protein [Terriglobales bacterium]